MLKTIGLQRGWHEIFAILSAKRFLLYEPAKRAPVIEKIYLSCVTMYMYLSV